MKAPLPNDSFKLQLGEEKLKAKDFLTDLRKVMEKMAENDDGTHVYKGQVAYKALDWLYETLTSEHDYGYILSFINDEGTYVEDVCYDLQRDTYESLVGRYAEFDGRNDGWLSRLEVANLFWSTLAAEVLMGVPSDFSETVKHVERGVISMFTGMNRTGLTFTLRYVEKNIQDDLYYSTDCLGSYLSLPDFGF